MQPTPQELYDDFLKGINSINDSYHIDKTLKCFSSWRWLWGNLRKEIWSTRCIKWVNPPKTIMSYFGFHLCKKWLSWMRLMRQTPALSYEDRGLRGKFFVPTRMAIGWRSKGIKDLSNFIKTHANYHKERYKRSKVRIHPKVPRTIRVKNKRVVIIAPLYKE